MRAPCRSLALVAALIPVAAHGQVRRGMMNVGDASLNYEVTGTGDRAVVFINGWALRLQVWDNQMAAFSPAYRVVRYDLRGFAKSTGDADRTADPDDLRILLDSLGIRSAHLVGLSRGAGIAADFAVHWPERVRGLVLYGMGPTPDFPVPPEFRDGPPFARIARQYGMDSLRKWVAASPLVWTPSGQPAVSLAGYDGRDLLHDRPPSRRVTLATVADLARLNVPTLLVNGDHDMSLMLTVADTLARRMPRVRRAIIVNGGHGAHLHQPEAFSRDVLAFLAGVDSTTRVTSPP